MILTITQRNSLVQEYLWCIDSVIKQNYSLIQAAHLAGTMCTSPSLCA